MKLFKIFILGVLFAACDRAPKSDLKVVGGRPSTEHHPFFVQLLDRPNSSEGFCGGTLIAPRLVMTAAHCIEAAMTRNLHVAMGIADGDNLHLTRPVKVTGIVVHPDFNDETFKNDIALLYLAEYELGQFERPVAPIAYLREERDPVSKFKSGRVIGLGNTTSLGSIFDNVIREADVPLITGKLCDEAYSGADDSQICAGDLNKGGLDTCQGDSGGPMLVRDKSGRWLLAGIVSYGEGCAQKKFPGVYTNVGAFSDFIDDAARQLMESREAPGDEIARLIKTKCVSQFGYIPMIAKTSSAFRQTTYSMDITRFELKPSPDPIEGEFVDHCVIGDHAPAIEARWIKVKTGNLSSAPKIAVEVLVGGQRYVSKTQVLRYVEDHIRCNSGEGQVTLADMRHQTFVGFKDVMYLPGEAAPPPGDNQKTWGCSLDDASIEVYEIGDGAEKTLAGRIHHKSIGTVSVKLVRADKETKLFASISWDQSGHGVLSITNDEAVDDLFTWSLSCPAPFKLTFDDGRELTAARGKLIVDKSEFPAGTVVARSKLQVTIQSLTDKPIEGCSLNDAWPVESWIR